MALKGRTAVVTGGAVRLGRSLAERLAREGADVCLHCHSSVAAAAKTLEQIRACGVRATVVQADFSRPAHATRAVFDHAARELGPVNVLVNSAAIFLPGNLEDTTEADWDRHHNVNLKTPILLSQEFARRLPDGARGHIVNIVDWRGLHPVPGHLAYTLAKSGLVAATRLLAQELAPRIQVNAIAPGAILPPPGEPDAYLERLATRIPLGRTGRPEDVADALVYLLQSEFVTGAVLPVTGGEELGM
jgi:NAD(P)-dependent dehydrogenase (short-subunit alcohol dehydrogenase family)